MAISIEIGHAKNVANFEQLTTFISGYGAIYNPLLRFCNFKK